MDIERKSPDHGSLVEFLNSFVIKGSKIFFEKEGIMYVISKQTMVHAFGVCQIGYIEDPKGQVNKLVVGKLLYNHVSSHHTQMELSGM